VPKRKSARELNQKKENLRQQGPRTPFGRKQGLSRRSDKVLSVLTPLRDLAIQYQFPIIADEVYHFLNYSSQPAPPPLMAYDNGRAVIYSLGSFTKIAGPGLRLGWIHTKYAPFHEWFTNQAEIQAGGGATPFLTHVLMNALHENWIDEHVASLKEQYKNQLEVLSSSLRQFLPTAQWVDPLGGYFLWLNLRGINLKEVLALPNRDVNFQIGTRFSVNSPKDFEDCMRLCFTGYSTDDLREGAERIGKLVDQVKNRTKT